MTKKTTLSIIPIQQKTIPQISKTSSNFTNYSRISKVKEMTHSNTQSTHLSVRLPPHLCDVCNTLSTTLQISRSQVIKQALAHYHTTLFPPNVTQTSHTLARARGIYTSFNTKRAIHPLHSVPNTDASGAEEEENSNSYSKYGDDEISRDFKDDEKFEKWWLFYPKFQGMRPDKEKCRQAWHDLGADDGFDSIMSCTKRLKATKSWQEGFVPMPLNYLRRKLWRNAPEPDPLHVIHGQ